MGRGWFRGGQGHSGLLSGEPHQFGHRFRQPRNPNSHRSRASSPLILRFFLVLIYIIRPIISHLNMEMNADQQQRSWYEFSSGRHQQQDGQQQDQDPSSSVQDVFFSSPDSAGSQQQQRARQQQQQQQTSYYHHAASQAYNTAAAASHGQFVLYCSPRPALFFLILKRAGPEGFYSRPKRSCVFSSTVEANKK